MAVSLCEKVPPKVVGGWICLILTLFHPLYGHSTRNPFAPIPSVKESTPDKQVWLEARIVEMEEQAVEVLGMALSTVAGPAQYGQRFMPPSSHSAPSLKLTALSPYILDLELRALESEGMSKMLASPSLFVQSGHEALIHQGQEVPYVAKDRERINVAFKQAVLSLKVKPTVQGEEVSMQIDMTKDAVSVAQTDASLPMIDTRQLRTRVIVPSGQTVMLGGIIEHTTQTHVQRLPVLGHLPVIGNVFQSHSKHTLKKQVVIFITPHILPKE